MHMLPKVELHLHLDCSLSYSAAVHLDPELTLARYAQDMVAPPKCLNLADYLSCTVMMVDLLQNERALRLAVDDLMRQLAQDSVIYAELRLAPLLHLQNGLRPMRVVEIVEEQVEQACAATGVEARVILCTLRRFTADQSMATAQLAVEFKGSRVVALDLAGDEGAYSLEAHVAAFEHAAAHGVQRTAHAGEARGPASVWETLERLHPSRIGHGVRSIDDPALIDYLIAQDIHLEVCPATNVQINLFDTYADHPVNTLFRRGVSVGINTDARATTPTTLTMDYGRLTDMFGWTHDELLAVNLNAIRAAFAPPDVRDTIERRLRAAYNGARA